MKITKRQLRRLIKEEKAKLLAEEERERAWEYSDDDEIRQLGMAVDGILDETSSIYTVTESMGTRYGELTALITHARALKQAATDFANKFDRALDNLSKSKERGWYDK
jgi:hypothetical protein